MVKKKNLAKRLTEKRTMLEIDEPISMRRQCELIGLNRASYYYEAAPESDLNLELMRRIDEQYTQTPFYGWPRMTVCLQKQGYQVNHKRVYRLMKKMGIQAIYPHKRLKNEPQPHKIYPYLLQDMRIEQPNQVWSSDITYIPMQQGFMYLVAVIDWFSRFVLAWQLSNSLDSYFCQVALQQALTQGQPDIFNTDQGVQFTATDFTDILQQAHIQISMDGRGRALDNIFIERLWRSLKYENIYLHDYATVPELRAGLDHYFTFYNYERPHQSLGYQVPAEVHLAQHLITYVN